MDPFQHPDPTAYFNAFDILKEYKVFNGEYFPREGGDHPSLELKTYGFEYNPELNLCRGYLHVQDSNLGRVREPLLVRSLDWVLSQKTIFVYPWDVQQKGTVSHRVTFIPGPYFVLEREQFKVDQDYVNDCDVLCGAQTAVRNGIELFYRQFSTGQRSLIDGVMIYNPRNWIVNLEMFYEPGYPATPHISNTITNHLLKGINDVY